MKWWAYSEYEESGVPWLGRIPDSWYVAPLKRGLARNDGGVWGEDFDDDGTIVLRSTEIALDGSWQIEEPARRRLTGKERKDGRLEVGDLLVTKSSGSALHLGKTAVVTEDVAAMNCCFSNFTQRLRVNTRLHPRYLFWILNCPVGRDQLVFLGTTTTGLANLNTEVIGAVQIPFSTLAEQSAIAAFLDRETERIDALIARKERQIELLQEKRAALISHVVTKGLDPDAPMKDSGVEWLGEIPAHWELMPLKFAALQKPDAIKTGPFGSQLLSSEMMDSEVKVYNQRNVIDQDLAQGDNYVSKEKFEELRAFTVYPGDVLVTTRGTIGRCVVVPDDADLGILHPCLMRVQPDPRKLLARFLVLLIQDSFLVQTQLFLMSNATTIEVIYSGNLRDAIVPIPPVQEQCTIIAHLDRETSKIDILIAKVQETIERLQEYRTALISAAVTGKIQVQRTSEVRCT